MTFLELVARLHQECGVSGSAPDTVIGQTGMMKRLVDWTAQAWVDIQNERFDWDFLKKPFTFNTVAAQQEYSAAGDISLADFKRWVNDSFRAYLTSAGVATEVILSQYPNYEDFRNFYLLGSRRLVTGRPLYVVIAPNRNLILGFTPNDVYTVSGEYWRSAQRLALDADGPIIPEDYQMLIVYYAMKKYGYFDVAAEQLATAKEESTKLYNRLVFDYTPRIECGDSLI
jgi:hypothetical protein